MQTVTVMTRVLEAESEASSSGFTPMVRDSSLCLCFILKSENSNSVNRQTLFNQLSLDYVTNGGLHLK